MITGVIIKNLARNEILVETENGDTYQLPRTSAITIYGNGRVDFEKWKAFRIEPGDK